MSARRLPVRRLPPARARVATDPDAVVPANRFDTLPVGLGALVLVFMALSYSALHGLMLLYGDAVAHLGIARRIVDTNTPGLGNLGGVWLPLPHLLMLPFIGRMEWWQDGMAGAWPSMACYIVGTMGLFRLARRMMPAMYALVATAFFALNPNLLYLATTAMTEPLFLALLVWIVLVTLELGDAITANAGASIKLRLLLLGVLVLAATLTRYDGWVLGAAVWCYVGWRLLNVAGLERGVWGYFVLFTMLAAAGPLWWFEYNHVYGHDWLDFMRGPYSAKEIDRKTSPPGAHKYWGWHNPAWSLMLYARTAQVDASAWETGWVVAFGALWGTWAAVRAGVGRAALLLWLPLPFYVYSISYGSVPIFIPQLYPHAYYNSRYGMEMLPAFAIFGAWALWAGVRRLGRWQALGARLVLPVALLLTVLSTAWMLKSTPLVLREAEVNSRGRLAFEDPIARQLDAFVPGLPILMENSDHVGVLQKAGIPLRQTIGPSDWYGWQRGLANPAAAAGYVVAVDGQPLAEAVKAHPEGLTELSIVCATGQPCARIYQSEIYRKGTR